MGKTLRIGKVSFDRAKKEKVWKVTIGLRRVSGLIGSPNPRFCWIEESGKAWCSCGRLPVVRGLCPHLGVLVALFTDHELVVV